ncbi:MAG: mechanosensitive ion channel [Deltaproteobacteria bacterium]|nr:mechanosensitive ion channel [Deltaproteobacteria bacterium]
MRWSQAIAEAMDNQSLLLAAGLILTIAVTRLAPREQRPRLRGPIGLTVLHVILVPIAAAFRDHVGTVYRDVRLPCLIFGALAGISMAGTVLFSVLLPLLRLRTPRILQDVLGAGASLLAVFAIATRSGYNLSGLIATSAVLTAVIGFSLQDTLGNIMGGLALQMDNSIKVGDWIKIGDLSGRVSEIRWRYTAIETRNWETVIVPNSVLMKGQVMVLGRRTGQPLKWRRWVYFNVDFRYQPPDVISAVLEALDGAPIEHVARDPAPSCILMDLHESYGRYAVRYWLTDLAPDDPTDSEVRTRVYFALKRAGIPLSIPAHAIFMTEETTQRRAEKSRADHDRRIAALSNVDLFSHLPAPELHELADELRYAPFARGETLTRQGAEAHWLYMIVEGEVSVRVSVDGGLEREVARLRQGNFFGEMSLMTGERRSATVVATTDVECYRLEKASFQEALRKRPELAEEVAEILAKRRVELAAVKEGLDLEAQRSRLLAAKSDLLGRIRDFFGLSEDERRVVG